MSFGKLIGKTKCNVGVYSNANPPLQRQRNFYCGEFTGIQYECVEFARRFLIAARTYTFPEVKSAVDIWKLKRFLSVEQHTEIPIRHYFPDKESKVRIGDLVIFSSSVDSPHGHVAVVTAARSYKDKLIIYICDQNFSNDSFDKSYNGRVIISAEGTISDRGTLIGIVGARYK